jgi:gamma-glutamylcyclotransferase (GGCT)/AIG2-like uncharacterized protein YtfP
MQRLFVYGSLSPGRSNHAVMADIPGTWEPATLNGHLHDEGWGAELGCPGIVPSPDGEVVNGYVLSSPVLTGHWAKLDAFEGEGYERVPVTVTVNERHEVDAFVYALKRDA